MPSSFSKIKNLVLKFKNLSRDDILEKIRYSVLFAENKIANT